MAKKKYEVTFYYHTNMYVTVEAESEEEALRLARKKDVDIEDCISGLYEDGEPDVECIEDE